MAAIAARVGGSKATLYNYFPSKESLFAALVRRECEEQLIAPLIQQGASEDPAEGLRQIGARFAAFTLSERALSLYRVVLAEACRFPDLGRAFYDNGPRRTAALLAEWIAEHRAGGRLAVEDASLAADQFMDLCRAGLVHRALWNIAPPPTEADLVRTVDAAVGVFIAAYGVAGER
jgi:AcrR family transcriptional regulator